MYFPTLTTSLLAIGLYILKTIEEPTPNSTNDKIDNMLVNKPFNPRYSFDKTNKNIVLKANDKSKFKICEEIPDAAVFKALLVLEFLLKYFLFFLHYNLF